MTLGFAQRPLRLYWFFPVLIAIYGICGQPNTPGFILPTLVCALAIGLVLAVTQHNVLSLVSIVAMVHTLFYPMAVVFNLMLDHHALFDDAFWPPTPLAMYACALGMLGFAAGSFLADNTGTVAVRRIARRGLPHYAGPAAWRNLLLCSLIIPLAIFKLKTNTYYYILAAGNEGWSQENSLSYGYVGYLEFVAYAGVFLQMRRFFITETKKDMLFAFICVFLPIIVMLPSGSRDATLVGPAVAVVIATLGYGKITRMKTLLTMTGIAAVVLLLMVVIAIYRVRLKTDGNIQGVTQRVTYLREELQDVGRSSGITPHDYLVILASRFADYIAVGKIVDEFPRLHSFRHFRDVEFWPVYLLPNPLRPATPGFDSRDGAMLCQEIGMETGGGGSSPAMIIGDLFSRFGWFGVFAGMIPLGFFLRKLDHVLRRLQLLGLVLFAMLLPATRHLPFDTAFIWFLYFTRALLITAFLAWITTQLLRFKIRWGRAKSESPGMALTSQ